jgi:hypothetical protein
MTTNWKTLIQENVKTGSYNVVDLDMAKRNLPEAIKHGKPYAGIGRLTNPEQVTDLFEKVETLCRNAPSTPSPITSGL